MRDAVPVESTSDISYPQVAYLRDGRFAAVVATLAVLHQRGLVDAGRAGTVCRTDEVSPPTDVIEHAVWAALHGSVSPAGLVERPQVRVAFAAMRRDLVRAKMLRRWLPARSWLPARKRL